MSGKCRRLPSENTSVRGINRSNLHGRRGGALAVLSPRSLTKSDFLVLIPLSPGNSIRRPGKFKRVPGNFIRQVGEFFLWNGEIIKIPGENWKRGEFELKTGESVKIADETQTHGGESIKIAGYSLRRSGNL